MEQAETLRVLGVAEYEARWVQRSFLVELTASGILPCGNYQAQLEQRPEKVPPPLWDMVFYVQDHCVRRTKTFTCKAMFINTTGAQSVRVRDASGDIEVPIQPAFDGTMTMSRFELGATENHLVYARLPRPDSGHFGCIVVPEGTMVSAIHYRAFGPALKEDCDRFVLDHCGPLPPDYGFRGDEIPWPLLPLK